MDAITKKALRGSIRKWERILSGKDVDRGPDNCPLCVLFLAVDPSTEDFGCVGCPVEAHTNEPFCIGTPYDEWSSRTSAAAARRIVTDEERRLAEKELAFLKSLLPSKEE